MCSASSWREEFPRGPGYGGDPRAERGRRVCARVNLPHLGLGKLLLNEDTPALQAIPDGDQSFVLLLGLHRFPLQALYLNVVVSAHAGKRKVLHSNQTHITHDQKRTHGLMCTLPLKDQEENCPLEMVSVLNPFCIAH